MELQNRWDKILKVLIFVGLLALIVLIFSQKIELTSVDLGRHLANGRVVWQDSGVLFRNFYSYTEPDWRFVNHHWLGGVILYAVYQLGGFTLLSVFNIVLAILVFSLAFISARRRMGFYPAALLSLPVIFLLSERVEIRPEIFSYLFIFIVWRLIDRVAVDKNYKRLAWLVPLFILWTNTHIYFFVGLALLGFKALADFIPTFLTSWRQPKIGFRAGWLASKIWVYTLILSSLAALINPNTWRGLLYPFQIFANYGYEIAENKSVFFLENLILNPNFSLIKIVVGLLIISWILYWLTQKKNRWFDFLLSLFFIGLGLMAVRNISLAALAALVIMSGNLEPLVKYFQAPSLRSETAAFWRSFSKPIIIGLVIISSFIYLYHDFSSNNFFVRNNLGWGLAENNDASAKFFQDKKLQGPIFNNYDIGSALIFWLYPAERVFVDNRPEAYSADFFQDIYKPMQTDLQKWREYSKLYKIKTIYFSHVDSTPWAQDFLRFILADPDWSLVYFDSYSVILLNKEAYGQEEIKTLSIDSWQFRSRLRDLAARADLKDSFRLAILAQSAGQPDLAEEIYRKILFDYPGNNTALVSFGYLYSSSQDAFYLKRSIDYFKSAIKSGYNLPGVYVASGLAHWRLGEYQKAEADWRSALEIDDNDESALEYLNQLDKLRQAGKIPLVK